MPFSGDTFTKLYSWLTDPQRNEKIFNSRLDDEFGGIATGLTTLAGDVTEIETDITELSDAIAAIGGPPVAPACFSAHKNGTTQTGMADSTFTLVTFSTEVYDVGNYFASDTWTPPAGKVAIQAGCFSFATVSLGNQTLVSIYKNGAEFHSAVASVTSLGGGLPISIEDIANGSDAYTVYAYLNLDSGTGSISGFVPYTYFMGHWISA